VPSDLNHHPDGNSSNRWCSGGVKSDDFTCPFSLWKRGTNNPQQSGLSVVVSVGLILVANPNHTILIEVHRTDSMMAVHSSAFTPLQMAVL